MSYIKRLKLKGFKSFANPTVLEFEDGFNTVVGANGSGKSNVFDAMCFVLGRMSSKGLRADKLGNLVFNGGKNLKAAKDAEVSIYLTNYERELMNVELDEIKISRIVTKSGLSKYLLNNNKVTRTEIVEVLRRAHINPDGYNIILQGDIMKIVNMSPIERRQLIEEISNISGYEEKREKGLKKLETVELNLKDADLLMEEKTKYLKELRSEKDLAEKFHKVKNDLREDNLLLVKAKIKRNTSIKIKKEDELNKNEEILINHKNKLNEFENNIESINTQITSLEKEIEIQSHNNFIEVTNKITSLEIEIKNLKEKKSEFQKNSLEVKTRNEGIKENILVNKKKIKELELEIIDLNKQRNNLDKDLIEVEKEVSKLKLTVSDSGYQELDIIDKKLDELNDKKRDKDLIRQDNAIQVEKLNSKLEHLQDDLDKFVKQATENKDQIKELDKNRSELKKLIIEISKTANLNSETSSKLNNLNKEYSLLVENHSKLRIKAESQKDLISTNKAVESIVSLKSKDSHIHGTVAELASVPEKYSLALETLSGKSLFNLVVETDQTAVKYINYLKEKRIGNATFLPLNKINTKFRLDDKVLNKQGVIDYALNLIKFDKRYENIFHLIFNDAIVIERIEDAKSIGIGDYKMVTLDGDLVAKSGAMSGGFKSRSRGIGAFKDEKSVEKLMALDEKISRLQSTIDHLRNEKDDSERKLYDLRQRKIEVETEVMKFEKLLSIEGKDTSSINSEIEAILSDRSVIESSLKKISNDILLIDEEIKNLLLNKDKLKQGNFSKQDTFKSINEIEIKRDNLKENLRKITSQIDSRNIQINNVLNPELKNLEKINIELIESLNNIKIKLETLNKQLITNEDELKVLKIQEKELSKDYKQFIEKRDKLKEDRKKQEERYNKEFEVFDKVKEKSSQLRYSINEFETLNNTLNDELEILLEQIKVEFIVENEDDNLIGQDKINNLYKTIDERLEKDIDVKELQNKVNNLKSKLNSFGSINLKAVEIYDKLNDEFNKLLEKREILTTEKEEILLFIGEMDQKKKERFMETFVKLKENFINYYSKLSTKGDAELNVEDEKNLFSTGIEIKVRLSRNNYLDIKSLSGGEKTITAIAFIFAIQQFNPASFYIFDEVDAALDILNSEKLGKLIRENAHVAQYIVVSHSEYLIQSATSIYGVTMNKSKISDVVSLDLSEMNDYLDEEIK